MSSNRFDFNRANDQDPSSSTETGSIPRPSPAPKGPVYLPEVLAAAKARRKTSVQDAGDGEPRHARQDVSRFDAREDAFGSMGKMTLRGRAIRAGLVVALLAVPFIVGSGSLVSTQMASSKKMASEPVLSPEPVVTDSSVSEATAALADQAQSLAVDAAAVQSAPVAAPVEVAVPPSVATDAVATKVDNRLPTPSAPAVKKTTNAPVSVPTAIKSVPATVKPVVSAVPATVTATQQTVNQAQSNYNTIKPQLSSSLQAQIDAQFAAIKKQLASSGATGSLSASQNALLASALNMLKSTLAGLFH